MYLEKLKIFGFKSFANKTELKFIPGITGVVGPNGCGKSNIVDAIRWVLGEQKAGTLRSDRMENVIFNGTKSHKPLGMAEVSIILQNTNNTLPVDYSEVVITRRLFRSGESQYLLNNSACRLKDINDLLMDTGLAPDAYSVIELSMVEQILNGKAEDRRRIFEEAVGLTKYKQRRKLTFRKLDATEQDLVRIADIISEVQSKVNSLHRQVRRAQRYQKLSKSLTEAEIRVATHQFSQISEELDPLKKNFEESDQKRESLSSQISFREAEVESVQTELIDVEGELREYQTTLNNVKQTIQKKEEEILLSRERLKSLAENRVRIQNDIESLKQRIVERSEQLDRIKQERTKTAAEIENLQKKHHTEKENLDELEQRINIRKSEIKTAEQNVISVMKSVSENERNLERYKAQLENIIDAQQNLKSEKEELLKKIEQEIVEKQTQQKEFEVKSAELEELIAQQTALELDSEKLQDSISQLKNTILEKKNLLDSTQQRMAFIKNLLESYADYPEGVKHLMVEEEKGFPSVVADILHVEEQNQRAIEAALGEAATYLIAEDTDGALLGVNILKESKKGVVTFIPIDRLKADQKKPNLPSEDSIIGWVDSHVKCDEKYLPVIRALLGSTIIVKDIATAKKFGSDNRFESIQFVTQSGEVIYNWGGIRGGSRNNKSDSLIGRRDQLGKLSALLDKTNSELEAAEKKLSEHEQQQSENAHQKADAAQQLKKFQEDLAKQQLLISQIDYRIQQRKQRQKQIDDELASITENEQELAHQISQTKPLIDQSNEKYATMNNEIRAFQQNIDLLETDHKKQADVVNQLNLKIVEMTSYDKNLSRELEQSENLIRENEQTIKNREQDLLGNREEQQRLDSRIDELGEQLAASYKEKEKHETEVEAYEEKVRDLRKNVEEKSKVIKQLQSEREQLSQTLHEMELRISELRIKGDNLYRRVVEDFDFELKREPIDPDYEVAVDEEEIEKVKTRIKRLGPVNLLALKEYEKESERLEFLENQQEDLITAEQNLKETINHINETAQSKFDAIFSDIRRNFTKVFKDFFPEGEADLVLEQDVDPLEANIEIRANPKGKKMESLTLLSGGEKALTAISLLFGIYLVKPSPICILDEVDAPLDDNNVQRFLNTIKKFSNTTQFIMVTHNKLTMKSASSLYGITMQESGVSKIVSVKLE